MNHPLKKTHNTGGVFGGHLVLKNYFEPAGDRCPAQVAKIPYKAMAITQLVNHSLIYNKLKSLGPTALGLRVQYGRL